MFGKISREEILYVVVYILGEKSYLSTYAMKMSRIRKKCGYKIFHLRIRCLQFRRQNPQHPDDSEPTLLISRQINNVGSPPPPVPGCPGNFFLLPASFILTRTKHSTLMPYQLLASL